LIVHDDMVVGACGIDPLEDAPEIGYWLGARYWGRGLATEAVRALIDHAFGDLQHEALQAGASIRLRAGCWRSAPFSRPACG